MRKISIKIKIECEDGSSLNEELIRDQGSKKANKIKAKEIIASLEESPGDHTLLGEGSFLKILLGELQSAGYLVRRSNIGRIKPGEKIRATHKSMHCGYCQHNCLLENPGCPIGKERALSSS